MAETDNDFFGPPVEQPGCPKCGGKLYVGYGFAGGGNTVISEGVCLDSGPLGGYELCMSDGCDYEKSFPSLDNQ